jgi:hypothetical protein
MRATQTLKDTVGVVSFVVIIYCVACTVIAAGAVLGFLIQS